MVSKKSVITLLFSVLLLWPEVLSAQDMWSLERCIEHAHRNNLQIKQQKVATSQFENNVQQAKLDFIPSFNASVNHSMNWGKSVNINDLQITNKLTQSTSANLSASMPLIQGLTKINTLKSSKIELLISRNDVEKLENDITIAITQAYLQTLLAAEIEKCAEATLKSTEGQVARTQKLVDAGSQAYSSLLEIQAQLANDRLQLVSAGNDLKNNRLNLMQLLDLPVGSSFNIEIPDMEDIAQRLPVGNIDEIFRSAQSLPQIKSAELALEKSRYDYKIQRGRVYPSISFSAGYGTYYSDSREQAFFSQFDDNRNPSIGFSMSIPIFNGWSTNTAIRNARLNIERSELELEKSHQQLYKEIAQAYNNAENAYEKYSAAEKNVAAARESFGYTEQKFNIGMVTGTEYVVAKNNLFKSESESLQAKFQYIFQMKILDFYRGVPIKL